MLRRLFSNCMLSPNDIAPSHPAMRVIGTFNPGVVREQVTGDVILLVRVVEEVIEKRVGYQPSPYISHDEVYVDWLPESDIDFSDPRIYRMMSTGLIRLRFISHLRAFRSRDGQTIDVPLGKIMPEMPHEIYGLEDPRITHINDAYYITYVAVSPHGAATALLRTEDFLAYERLGIIFAPDNKDVVLFPESIGGKYYAMHRPMPSLGLTRPEIWLAESSDLIHWGNHQQLLASKDSIHRDRIGGGTPPVKTRNGWLTIYHGSNKKHGEQSVGVYTAGAIMLDLNDPSRIVGQTNAPIMEPVEPYETSGFVDNVVFPTAIVPDDDRELVYYGAADEHTAVTAFKQEDLLNAIKPA
ncbi:glycoside hydrolase family 130 protein [Poriferisphaera sp. WC338]|uniref:glycoside hydrolase family 130 protein n=1 Tax=Poriferisphaera sp. WC338 TaxID=3425129 RepID=UPI003D81AC24